jgi:hypothetical protein
MQTAIGLRRIFDPGGGKHTAVLTGQITRLPLTPALQCKVKILLVTVGAPLDSQIFAGQD